jgi:hypothetical protein
VSAVAIQTDSVRPLSVFILMVYPSPGPRASADSPTDAQL